jgi:hypothetical protein
MACGSGACAAAVVARNASMVGDRVTVHQPGGDVVVDLSGPTVVLTGPADYVCTVEFPDGPGRGWGPTSRRRAAMGPRPGEPTWP